MATPTLTRAELEKLARVTLHKKNPDAYVVPSAFELAVLSLHDEAAIGVLMRKAIQSGALKEYPCPKSRTFRAGDLTRWCDRLRQTVQVRLTRLALVQAGDTGDPEKCAQAVVASQLRQIINVTPQK